MTRGAQERNKEISRLEVFVDAAFAFAITMLVISVDRVPASYEELLLALKGVPAFLVSFAAICVFWVGHKNWSRRFADEDDPLCMLLSLALVFVVLVYVYPLKAMAFAFFGWVSGGWLPSDFAVGEIGEMIGIFQIYGLGFAALAGTMALLFARSLARAAVLGLTPTVAWDARLHAAIWTVMAATGLASALWAMLLPPRIGIFAGFVYFVLFPATTAVNVGMRRAARRRGLPPEA